MPHHLHFHMQILDQLAQNSSFPDICHREASIFIDHASNTGTGHRAIMAAVVGETSAQAGLVVAGASIGTIDLTEISDLSTGPACVVQNTSESRRNVTAISFVLAGARVVAGGTMAFIQYL